MPQEREWTTRSWAVLQSELRDCPPPAAINAVIVKDISSLPNAGSLVVNICQNNNGTSTNLLGSCTAPRTQSRSYVLTLVDVTYTYGHISQRSIIPV